MTALHHAAMHGKDNVIAVLLEKGANANARTAAGKTAAELATTKGYMRCAEICDRKKPANNKKPFELGPLLKGIMPKGNSSDRSKTDNRGQEES